ncbi:IclR family transcriptional regulator [Bacillus dakarensis]|uniref:IclR family transcriptional regulator n=1 Tax=Robertmurraya dakarensis TaxID=1926278 RepID=UPI0009812C3A|nr:IclR family transcriptional regulator [Bacillus dakarensis]
MSDKSVIQSVQKAAIILKLFNKKEPMLTLQEIHQKTGFTKTTAMRFCTTLTSIGFLEKVYIGQAPYYRLGIELFTIGSTVINTIDLPERARKYLQEISNTLEDNSYLFIVRNNKAYCIDAVKGSYYIQDATTNIGDVLPLNIGGGPLAILAYIHMDDQNQIIDSFNLNDEERKELKERLENIRTAGYSFSSNETNLNTSAIGVPIFNHEGKVVGSLSVGGIEIRFNKDRVPKIIEVIREAGYKFSRELGWQG